MNILITGGSSGLGKALVEILAQNTENQVYFTFNNKEKESRILENSYKNVRAFRVDFTNMENIKEFTHLLPNLDIDVLVNNAYVGNPQGNYIHKTDLEDYFESFKVNILPTINITQKCLEGMKKRKFGKVINILTSYLIDLPPNGFSVYCCSKAYIRQFSKNLVKEFSRYNISCNSVLPEFMNTGFGKIEDFQLAQMESSHPLKKILNTKEVAEIINILINSSQQLNGAEIPVNAGQHIL